MQETITFTLSELCANVESSKTNELIIDFYAAFDKAIRANDSNRILNLLITMRLYFEKVQVETLVAGQNLSILSLELVAYKGDQAEAVYTELGRFLSVRLLGHAQHLKRRTLRGFDDKYLRFSQTNRYRKKILRWNRKQRNHKRVC